MKYHNGPRFGLPEAVQSTIYWTCQRFFTLPAATQQIIRDAAAKTGERDAAVVLEALTTQEPIPEISLRYLCTGTPIDASELTRKVGLAYRELARTLPGLDA